MNYRRARMVLLGLLIVFPLLVRGASAPELSGRHDGAWSQATPILCVELLLLGGVLAADWNRRRLLDECLRRVDGTRTMREPARPAALRRSLVGRRTSAADTA